MPTPNPQPALAWHKISVSLDGSAIVSNLSATLQPAGQIIGLLGANGAGKSTLLKAMAGLLPHTGSLFLKGQDLSVMMQADRMRGVAYLPQSLPHPSPLLAYETILSALRAAHHHLSHAESEDRIEAVVEQLGLQQLIFRRLNQLSGGQRQMIGLAHVLVRHADLLLLDEPTSALDLHWQMTVLHSLRHHICQSNGVAVVALHDLGLAARFCDQVMVLAAGTILGLGTPEDVLTPAMLRQAYGVVGRVERCSQGHPMVMIDAVHPF